MRVSVHVGFLSRCERVKYIVAIINITSYFYRNETTSLVFIILRIVFCKNVCYYKGNIV